MSAGIGGIGVIELLLGLACCGVSLVAVGAVAFFVVRSQRKPEP